jgi:glycosyltransferase involved in cell wall biosynthesis
MSIERNNRGGTVALFSDAPYAGGAEHYLVLLAKGIRDCGFRPVLIINGKGKLDTLEAAMRDLGMDVYEVSLDVTLTKVGVADALRLLRSLRCSIFHINLPGPFDAHYSLVAPLARMAGIRNVVTTEHLPMTPSFAKGRIIKGFSTLFISRIITVSEDNVTHLIENHHVPSAKIRVVHNGVPDTALVEPVDIRGRLGLGKEAFLVATVGELTERKGQMTLFRAMRYTSDRVHLLVVGEGPMEHEYRQAVPKLSLGGRVHFLGFRSDVPALLKGVDVLSVPSLIEATPYVILEAMAAGVPAIANRIYGIPEQIVTGETGLLVRQGDEDELTAALNELAGDAALVKRMGEKARQRYEELFTLERFTKGTVEVYRELTEA